MKGLVKILDQHGTVLRVDFKLLLGERTEVVEVTDADTQVNTETSRLSQTVDSNQIANLPLNGRNVYDLIQYAPGATNMRGVMYETSAANTVVNGVREDFNGGDGFAAALVHCSLRPVGLLALLTDLTGNFAKPTETFTPELPAVG